MKPSKFKREAAKAWKAELPLFKEAVAREIRRSTPDNARIYIDLLNDLSNAQWRELFDLIAKRENLGTDGRGISFQEEFEDEFGDKIEGTFALSFDVEEAANALTFDQLHILVCDALLRYGFVFNTEVKRLFGS